MKAALPRGVVPHTLHHAQLIDYSRLALFGQVISLFGHVFPKTDLAPLLPPPPPLLHFFFFPKLCLEASGGPAGLRKSSSLNY
jgi:hypothetical protein